MNIQRRVQSFSKGDEIESVSKVVINYGVGERGQTLYKETGDDTGRTLEITLSIIPDGDIVSTIASNILNSIQTYGYNSFTATGAELDPASELFDSITVNSIDSVIGSLDTDFNQGMYADIEAPGLPEEDDFPYTPVALRTSERAERSSATNKAQLEVTATEIRSEIDDATNNLTSQISQTASGLRLEISAVQDNLEDHETLQEQYIQFTSSGLELGESTSPFKAKLTNTELGFYQGSSKVAYISNEALNITRAQVATELKIGNIVFIQRSAGDVAIKWRS